MPVSSLFDMAMRSCMRNHQRIDDLGDLRWDLARPILSKIQNPEQLRTIEENSPHLRDNTSEIWRALIKKKIPDYARSPCEPKHPRNWGKLYMKLQREADREIERQALELQQKFKNLHDEQNKHTARSLSIMDARKKLSQTALAKGGLVASSSVRRPLPKKPKTIFEKAREERRTMTRLGKPQLPSVYSSQPVNAVQRTSNAAGSTSGAAQSPAPGSTPDDNLTKAERRERALLRANVISKPLIPAARSTALSSSRPRPGQTPSPSKNSRPQAGSPMGSRPPPSSVRPPPGPPTSQKADQKRKADLAMFIEPKRRRPA